MGARAWSGYSTRWTGAEYEVPVVSPVVILGHDSSDGGGMRGVSAPLVSGVVNRGAVVLTSELGFAWWSLAGSTPAGTDPIGVRVSIVFQHPLPGAVPSGTPSWLYTGDRDVSAEVFSEPPSAILGVLIKLQERVFIPLARPVVVPPRAFLFLQSVFSADSDVTLFFEEGL